MDYDDLNIPHEIKSETYFGKGIFLLDLGVIFGFWLVMSSFDNLIDDKMTAFYTIFNVVIGFLITRKSRTNPQKRIYECWIIYFLSLKNNKFHLNGRRNHGEIELTEK